MQIIQLENPKLPLYCLTTIFLPLLLVHFPTQLHILYINNNQIPNPNLRLWQQQDILVRNAIMESVNATIVSLIAHASATKEA